MNKQNFDYLNNVVDNKKGTYKGPRILYKYRSFNEYTFDMLKNNYVWLAKVSTLDDPTECHITLTEENYFDIVNGTLRRECVEQILSSLKEYMSSADYGICRNIIYSAMTPDFKIRPNYLLDASFELEKLAPNAPSDLITNVVNELVNIPELLDNPEIKPQIEGLLSQGINAREDMGVCSLAEESNNEKLWEVYASNYSGCCIEYDLSDYEYIDSLLPVEYEEVRETNLVIQLVKTFIGQMIKQFSNGQIEADRSQYLRLFLTKDKIWSYQKEWRLIGNANVKIKAPKIRRIIIGKNATKENIDKVIKICKKNNIVYKFEE